MTIDRHTLHRRQHRLIDLEAAWRHKSMLDRNDEVNIWVPHRQFTERAETASALWTGISSLLDELGMEPILEKQLPPYQRHLLDRLHRLVVALDEEIDQFDPLLWESDCDCHAAASLRPNSYRRQ